MPSKRSKTSTDTANAFQLPEDKPDLKDLRIEPKDYFGFQRSVKNNFSVHETDGKAGSSFSCTTV